MDRYHRAPILPITFAAIVSLQLSLAACSPNQLSPPPPFVPYEATPGDAANVKRAVDNIRASQHSVAPSFVQSTSRSPFPYMTGYPAILTIANQTDCKLGLYFRGPSPRQLGIAPGQSERFYIAEGKYEYVIDTRLCANKLPPLYGEEIFSAGHPYTLLVPQQDGGKGVRGVKPRARRCSMLGSKPAEWRKWAL